MNNDNGRMSLYYRQPADKWEEALPVGNGRLGGMVFGGVQEERIALNEDSVWAGEPYEEPNDGVLEHVVEVRRLLLAGRYAEAQKVAQAHITMANDPRYGSYQPLGEILIRFSQPEDEIRDYVRTLDLENAIAVTSYRIGETGYTRTVWCSAPDQVLVVAIRADRPASLHGEVTLSRQKGPSAYAEEVKSLHLDGRCEYGGVHFHVQGQIAASGGKVGLRGSALTFESCDEVLIFLAANTSYRTSHPEERCRLQIESAAGQAYEDLLSAHIKDYRLLYSRFSINLGHSAADALPVDRRLERLREGEDDPGLMALYVQFGRYLLISSSRPGTLPANLQGIWNASYTPPWFSDYTININAQMNYWPAETAALPECHLPLLDFIDHVLPAARRTARERYGCRGIALSTRTNPWTNASLRSYAHLLWQEGAAWLSLHLWDHYLFSGDTEFLRTRAYPVMKEAAIFYLDFMVPHPESGWLLSGPSTSPENHFLTREGEKCAVDMSPTMTVQIIAELFDQCMRASEILDVDESFREELAVKRGKLPPMQIGRYGQLQEWLEDHEEAEPGHRHISHLFGVFPGHTIHSGTPDLQEAAIVALRRRLMNGGGHTGWSCAWIVNLWAHLGEAEEASRYVRRLLTHSTYDNLFDRHPPFQIDGNFGGAAGIIEMLVQSDEQVIHLLPALPSDWPTGFVRGIKARGGFELDMHWRNGKLERLSLTASQKRYCSLRYRERLEALAPSVSLAMEYLLDGTIRFPVTPGMCSEWVPLHSH